MYKNTDETTRTLYIYICIGSLLHDKTFEGVKGRAMFVSTAIKALKIAVYIIANLHATWVIRLSVTCILRNGCSVRTA